MHRIVLKIWYFVVFAFLSWNSELLAQATPSFSMLNNKGCAPIKVQFNNHSTGKIVSYSWDFGNGNNSTLKNPSAIYTRPGVYTISLTIKDSSGFTYTTTKPNSVEVFKSPTANFSSSTTKACINENISFTSSSTQGGAIITSYKWDFGDGNVQYTQNPLKSYTLSGRFNVLLLIKDNNGCEDVLSKPSYMQIHPEANSNFSISDSIGCSLPHKSSFTAAGSNVSYNWNFGDGGQGSNSQTNHTYNFRSNFGVTLSVIDKNNCKSQTRKTVSIQQLSINFTTKDKVTCHGEKVRLQAVSNLGLAQVNYSWNVANQLSNQSYFELTNLKPGYHSIKLNATQGTCKASMQALLYLKVNALPVPDVEIKDKILCPPNRQLVLIDHTPDIKKRDWEILVNDSIKQNYKTSYLGHKYYYSDDTNYILPKNKYIYKNIGTVRHLFKFPGDLSYFTLTMEDKNGCKSTVHDSISISNLKGGIGASASNTQNPNRHGMDPLITYNNKKYFLISGCDPFDYSINNASYSFFYIQNQKWYIEDQFIDSIPEIKGNMSGIGKFKLGKMVVTDKVGCTDTVDFMLRPGEKTNQKVGSLKERYCYLDELQLYDSSKAPPTIHQKIFYTSEKEAINKGQKLDFVHDSFPIHYYSRNYGCFNDTTTFYIKVLGPIAGIGADFRKCADDSALVWNASIDADSIAWFEVNKDRNFMDSFRFPVDEGQILKLVSWNHINGCKDSTYIGLETLEPIIKVDWPEFNTCAPVKDQYTVQCSKPYYVERFLNGVPLDSNRIQTFIPKNRTYIDSVRFYETGTYKVRLKITTIDSCSYFREKTFIIPGIQLAGKVVTLDKCLPISIELIDSNFKQNNKNSLYWTIGKDTLHHTNKSENVTIEQNNVNNRLDIILIGVDTVGCISKQRFNIPLNGPYADVDIKSYPDCFTTKFRGGISNIQGPHIGWKWYNNDTYFSNKEFAYLDLDTNQTTVFKMVLEDSVGCKHVTRDTLQYIKSMYGNITADNLKGACPPTLIQFKSNISTTSRIERYYWDFGDNTYSTLKNPSKIYLQAGSFQVKLTTTDFIGCTKDFYLAEKVLINGPTGIFDFLPRTGCAPHAVVFKLQTNPSNSISLDFGNGIVRSDSLENFTYSQAGTYIPQVILIDSIGCTSFIPAKDTIYVYPPVLADFEGSIPCLDEETSFQITPSLYDVNYSYSWLLNGQKIDSGRVLKYTFRANGEQIITLLTENKYGCTKETSKNIFISKPKALYTIDTKNLCVGDSLVLTNQSSAESGILYHRWIIGEDTLWEETPKFIQSKSGILTLQLLVVDSLQCKDVFNKPNSVYIGDTNSKEDLLLHKLSVLNDHAIEITFQKDETPDFSSYKVYYINGNDFDLLNHTSNINDTVLIDPSQNTLHLSHCYVVKSEKHCSELPLEKLKKHCTIEATAIGKLNSIDVDWNPYFGWNEVDSYYVYREERLIKDSFTLIGKVDGNTFLYTDTTIYCREELFYRILAKQKTNTNTQWSWSDTTGAKPMYENAVPPNEIWRTTVVDDAYTSLEWLPITNSKFPIAYYKIQVGEGTDGFKEIDQKFTDPEFNFDYHKTKVDDYNYHFQMYAVDVCEDKSAISIPAKTVLLNVSVSEEFRPQLDWTTYQGWNEGVEEYIIEMEDEFGGFTEIGRAAPNDTSFIDEVSPFNCIENYCYRITAIRNQPDKNDSSFSVISHSNIDCAPVVSKIFAPNAFTRNEDGLNDEFTIKGIYIKEYNIKIFNRWGEKVYDSNSFKEHWDGTFGGQRVSQGVFVYMIEAKGVDNKLYHLSGDVTLLR